MTPIIDIQTNGVANQRIIAIKIKQQTIEITRPMRICFHESIKSSTII